MSSVLSIGQSALQAAQIGLSTTANNIANANTPGYSREVVVQGQAGAQNMGSGFEGQGTQVVTIQRVYNEYLNGQVMSSQSSKSLLDSYYSQISQIDNMLGDSTTGVSPALQGFFDGVQNLASNANSVPARQSMLSAAQTLTGTFQTMGNQLDEIRQGVNSQISTGVTTVNSYAAQIASLNDQIEKAVGASGGTQPPNALLDQRDQLVADLSKQVNVSLVKQGNSYNVFIGNGQPLVVGAQPFNLVTTVSQTDPNRTEIGISSNGKVTQLPENTLSGGALGGLFAFRANSLDAAQNALGRVATGIAMTFNAQHELGVDQNGQLGGKFFNTGAPVVNASSNNVGGAKVSASIADAGALTTSDYLVQTVTGAVPPAAGAYQVTRLSDGAVTNFTSFPQTVDGVVINLDSGNPASGDSFLVKPTAQGAVGFSVALTDTSKIAAAGPMTTSFTPTAPVITGYTAATPPGTSAISAPTTDITFTNATLTPAVTLTYDAATNSLSGFPADMAVTVDGAAPPAPYVAGDPVPYTDGATIAFGGVSFTISGTPADGDQFTIGNVAAGNAKIGPASVSTTSVLPSLSLSYDGTSLTGFPSQEPVTVTSGGVSTTYPAGSAVPYQAGDTLSFGGVQASGLPVTAGVAGSYTLDPAATLSYDAATNTLTNFPSYLDVTVTHNGTDTTYAAGTPVPYGDGDTISFGGVSFTVSGTPANGDSFTIGHNTTGKGDNSNALLLGALQTANTLAGGTASYQAAYGQLVSQIGNKASELNITSTAQGKLLDSSVAAQQSVSGVNLDEEATNLLRYQQAYQAAGKVMQTASQLFDMLLTLGQ